MVSNVLENLECVEPLHSRKANITKEVKYMMMSVQACPEPKEVCSIQLMASYNHNINNSSNSYNYANNINSGGNNFNINNARVNIFGFKRNVVQIGSVKNMLYFLNK
jgi:hypothetical protein